MASGSTFLTLTLNGVQELFSAITAFTGNANEIVATNGSGVIDKDLVLKTPYIFTHLRNNQGSSSFLRKEGNGDFTNLNPYRLPWDIEVLAVSAYNRLVDTDGWTAEVYLNGVINAGFTTVVAGGTSEQQNILGSPIAIAAGTQISTRALITSAISRPTILLFYQRT